MKISHTFLALTLLLQGATCYAGGRYLPETATGTATDTAEQPYAPQQNDPPGGAPYDGLSDHETLTQAFTWTPDPNDPNEPPSWHKFKQKYTVTGSGTVAPDGSNANGYAIAAGFPQHGDDNHIFCYHESTVADPHPNPKTVSPNPAPSWTDVSDPTYGSHTFNTESEFSIVGGAFPGATWPSSCTATVNATNTLVVSAENCPAPPIDQGGG